MPTKKTPPKQDAKPDVLTAKQQRFIEEYVIDCCGAAAAKRAGFSARSATETAYRLLKKPKIKAEIDARLKKAAERAQLSADFVRNFWRDAIEACAQDVLAFDLAGNPVLGKDGKQVYKKLDANSLRNLLADVAKHLQMFEKQDDAKDQDAGTGVMKVPGVASKEDWNGGN